MLKKYLLPILIGAGLLFAFSALATVFNSDQVGYNASSGFYLQTNGTTSTWVSIPSASTTVINGVSGPTFTFSIVGTSSQSSITTSSASLFLNLLTYSANAPISISSTGTIIFTNPGYITTSTNNFGGLTNASVTANSPIAWSSTSTISCPTCVTTATNFVNKLNGSTGTYNLYAGGILSAATGTASTTISLSTSTLNTQVAALGYSTSTGATPSGTSSDIQFNSNGAFGADTNNFDYSTSSKQLSLSAPTSSVVIGSSTYFSNVLINTLTFSTASSVASWTVPNNVTLLIINLTGAGGGSEAVSFGANGGNHSWLSTTSTVPVATSTMYALCGGGQGGGANAPGNPGQGVNNYPDTYGGSGAGTNSPGNPGSCFIGSTFTATSSGNAGNGAGGSQAGGPGGSATGTISVTPGQVFWYYLGSGGTTNNGGSTGGSGVLTIQVIGNIISSDQNFSLAIGNIILTGGSTPTASAATGGITMLPGSNNTSGGIINGSSTASVTLIFSTLTPYSNPAYFNNALCDAWIASGTTSLYFRQSFPSTTSTVFTSNANIPTSSVTAYFCIGH